MSKSKDSRFWRAQFWRRDADGTLKKVFRSTGTEDEREARRIMEVWMDATRGKVNGEQARRVLAELLGEGGRRITVRAFAGDWLAGRKGEVAAGTFEFYKKAVSGWLAGSGAVADQPIDSLKAADLAAWRTEATRIYSTKTVNHHLRCVRMILKAAVEAGWFRTSPAAGLRHLKETGEEKAAAGRRPFTRTELDKVLAVASVEWRAMVLLGLYTGQRLGDLARLRLSDLEDGAVGIAKTQKTGAKVWAPLPAVALAALAAVPRAKGAKASDPLLPGLYGDLMEKGKGKANELSRQFTDVLVAAGLREPELWVNRKVLAARKAAELATTGVVSKKRKGNELVFHSLRHNTRTWLEESGAPVAVIDALMGQDARTGRRSYTHIGKDAIRTAAEGIHGKMDTVAGAKAKPARKSRA